MLEAEDYKHETQDRKAMIQKQQHMQEYISAELGLLYGDMLSPRDVYKRQVVMETLCRF